MLTLLILAVAAFCAAGLGILVSFAEQDLTLALLSISAAISGVLFLAINRIISALEAIRDAVVAKPASRETNPPEG